MLQIDMEDGGAGLGEALRQQREGPHCPLQGESMRAELPKCAAPDMRLLVYRALQRSVGELNRAQQPQDGMSPCQAGVRMGR